MTTETAENTHPVEMSGERNFPSGIAVFENAAWANRKTGKPLPIEMGEAPRVLLFATGWATDERLFAPWVKSLEVLNYPAALVVL